MKKITLALLFVIGFTVLSCSKSHNHDDITDNTTKTPDETTINFQKIIGKWKLVKWYYLDKDQKQLEEEMKNEDPCSSSGYEFSKEASFIDFGKSIAKGFCEDYKYEGSWSIENSKITFVEKEEGEKHYIYDYKIVTLNDTILQLRDPYEMDKDLDGPDIRFIVKHYTRKN